MRTLRAVDLTKFLKKYFNVIALMAAVSVSFGSLAVRLAVFLSIAV